MINHLTLQGRLTRDPELRQTAGGVPVCSFTVAWSEKHKDRDQETRLFMPCTAWRATGEMISRNFSKGREIAVEGRLSTREWTDNEGGKRSVIELTVDRVHFCGPKPSDGGNAPEPSDGGNAPEPEAGSEQTFTEIQDDGDLPF